MTVKIDPFIELAIFIEGMQASVGLRGSPRFVTLDRLLDKAQEEYFRMKEFISQRAEEAFQSAVVDPEMWKMEAEAAGVRGVSLEEYKQNWIESWLEGYE